MKIFRNYANTELTSGINGSGSPGYDEVVAHHLDYSFLQYRVESAINQNVAAVKTVKLSAVAAGERWNIADT